MGGSVEQLVVNDGWRVMGSAGIVTVDGGGQPVVIPELEPDGEGVDLVSVSEEEAVGWLDRLGDVDWHGRKTVSVVVTFCVQHPPLITFVMFV